LRYFTHLCAANEPRPGRRPEGLVVGRPKTGPNQLLGRFVIQANINSFHFSVLVSLLGFALLAGCRESKPSAEEAARARPAAMSSQFRNELLTYAVDNLNRIDEFDAAEVLQQILRSLNPQEQTRAEPFDPLSASWPEPEMLRQVVDRLNQWIRVQTPPADWKADPLTAGLPELLAKLPQLKALDQMEFSQFDGHFLQEAVLLRDVARWTRGDALDDLERSKCLFDWIVRNIQLDPDRDNRILQFPQETLLFGRGTAADRAWVFVLLARQLGISAAVLGIEEGAETKNGKTPASTGPGVESKKKDASHAITSEKGTASEGSEHAQIAQPAHPATRLWCIGVLVEGHVYLFDPTLGLSIPGPEGIKHPEAGKLTIQPATLVQLTADEKLLRRLDADDAHHYPVKASDLKHVVVLLEGSPAYLSRRMKLLESRLASSQKMVLSASPTAEAAHWRTAVKESQPRLWTMPFETLYQRSHLDRKATQAQLAALLPFYAMPGAPLHRGRMLYLKGQLVGDTSATAFYQKSRPSNEELMASSAHPLEKLVYHRGKQDASYWLGLVAYQRGNYGAATDYFAKRTLLAMPNGPWTNGARYNLARTFEAAGETEKATLQYANNEDSPGYLGDLLRAKWLGQK